MSVGLVGRPVLFGEVLFDRFPGGEEVLTAFTCLGVGMGRARARRRILRWAGCTQHCILSIGVHIARYMNLLHLARNAHLARIARNMHDYVICADCARHAPVMQNYDRFLALRAMCTSSKFTIVRNMRIVSKWAYCAPCALRYAHYMHICRTPPRSCFIVSTIVVHDWGFCGQ